MTKPSNAARQARPAPAPPPDDQRILPHNLEAERSVLGAILIHNESFVELASLLTAKDFYRVAHRQIWEAVVTVVDDRKQGLDFVTLKDELARRGELEEVGGPSYISSLTDGLPHSSNIKHYAGIVREKARLRALIRTASALMVTAYDGAESSGALIAKADRALLDLQSAGDRRSLVGMTPGALLTDLEDRVATKGVLRGVDTGFASINGETMGWQAGDLIIIAARPSIGKTTFVMNSVVAGAGAQGKHVAIFSLEMRRIQLEYRMLASLAKVPLRKLFTGYLAPADYPPLNEAFTKIDQLPLYIADRAGQSAGDIRMACRRLRNETQLDLVVIDYVQLMAGSLDRRGATRNEEVTDISRKLKVLADELAVPVLLLSQLNRGADARLDPRPKLSDLRESGALEQDADLVCFLHRKNHREGGVTNFIIEKQRNGPTGTVNLTLDRDITLFTDGGEERQPTQEELDAEKADKTRKALRRRARSH